MSFIAIIKQKAKSLVLRFVSFVTTKVTKETIAVSAAAICGGLASLNFGLTRLFLWMVGPPRMSRQDRLSQVVEVLDVKRTLLVERQEAYLQRLHRITNLLHTIPRMENGPIRNRLRGFLTATVKTHQGLLEAKELPRLDLTIKLLEEAEAKLQDEDPN